MLSDRVKNLEASPTLVLVAKAKQLKLEGKDVISLSVGEPDWDTFPSIKQAGVKAIEQGQTKYTPASGTVELRKAISEQVNKDFGASYSVNQVTVSSGGKFIGYSALQATVNFGEEVLIPSPYWVSYPSMVMLSGGVPKIIECSKKDNFKLTAKSLAAALTDKTKALILNSPSNPTGLMYSLEELKALVEVLEKKPDVLVLSDDIYNRLVFSCDLAPHILHAEPSFVDRTVILNGASKSYSMTGWRIGWALGPEEVIQAMSRFQSQAAGCSSSVSQAAALQAITGAEAELEEARQSLIQRKNFVIEAVAQWPGVEVVEPDGAFYLWVDISSHIGKCYKGQTIKGTREFARALIEDKYVVVVPGADFGSEGYLRMSFVVKPERMQQALDRIGEFIAELS